LQEAPDTQSSAQFFLVQVMSQVAPFEQVLLSCFISAMQMVPTPPHSALQGALSQVKLQLLEL